jgi:neutral ceramidase
MSRPTVSSSAGLQAGAAVADLTPAGSVFLYGYPYVARDSTGVHDPLLCAALYLPYAFGAGDG